MEKVNWKVEGMSCTNCALTIHKYLEQKGVNNVKVNFIGGDISFDLNGSSTKKDIEKGSGSTNKPPKPRQDEIVPIYRRDCHEEVYAGSHPYPGHGVYLLKFDNSYSLWRSKTLYYRVYYSK